MTDRNGTDRTRRAARLLACAALIGVAPAPAPALAFDEVFLTLRDGPEAADEVTALTERLRGASLLVSLIDDEEATSRDIVAAARSDYTRLVEALFSEGRYSPVVRIRLNGREASNISPLGVPERIDSVTIEVAPGPQFSFGRAEVGPRAPGDLPPEGFRPGQPARAALVREAAETAVLAWRELGHPKAAITDQRVTARHRAAELDVAVEVTPGPRLRFGDTEVSGESAVRDNRVRQIAGLPKGEVYSPEAVAKAGARLRRAGAFRSVRLIEGDPLPDGTLDMEIAVVDRAPRRIGAGAELSSDNGLSLTAFWLHRNILGGAETLRFDAEIRQLAGVESDPDAILSTRFERPAVFGPDTLFFLEGELAYYDEPDFLTVGGEIAAGFSREVTDALTVESGVSLSYQEVTDRFRPGDPTRELFYVSTPTKATYDLRDDPLDATEGYFLEIEGEPFVETIEGDTGIRLDLDARIYAPIGAAGRVVVASRLTMGSLVGVDADAAPPDFLYYSGGGGSVRGQPYQSLTIDSGGQDLGGLSFAGVSSELRIGVTENIGAVLFTDTGLLSGQSDLTDLVGHSGAGIGLRYRTPVGPIRFDIAAPVTGDTGDGVQFYVGIGQAF